ncbi:MAG: hypothetical protein IJA67_00280 [Oscillospiraceae bacterium]|nr:hypothetical protein [Oscillospiraceae bacterium]
MKKKNRITASVLLAGQLLSIASCGGEIAVETQAVDTGIVTETEAVTEEAYSMPEVNMNGWELSILNYDETGLTWANTRICVEQADGDILNDALYNRNLLLRETFNCDISVKEVNDVANHVENLVLAGDNTYDIFVRSESNSVASYLPFVIDWNEIPHLQLDQPWWNPDATSVYNIGGIQAALAGNMSLSAVSRAVCMVFNKNVWTQYGDPDMNLYQLVEDNTWTVDRFLEITKSVSQDLNGDGKMDSQDLYGLNMGRGFKGYIASVLTGAGLNFTQLDTDGNLQFTLHTNEKSLSLVTKLMDALSDDGFYYNEDTSVHGFAPSDFFKNGHALFTQGVPHDIYKLRDMNDDIGILPMPKLNESQVKYYAAAWGGAVWTLSKTFDMEYADNLGILLDAMSYVTYRDVIPVYKEIALKAKTTRDDDSAAMLDIIFDSIYFDFGTNIMYDPLLANTFLVDLWRKKSSDAVVSTAEKYMPKIEKFIEDLYEAAGEVS